MGAEPDGSGGAKLPALNLRKVKERIQVPNDQQSSARNKAGIFSPRTSLHRVPLSSRRNNSNFTSAVASTGFKLPQAPFPNGTHAQLLQHSTSKLHSPRISNGYATARPNCNAAPLSPRRSSDKHSSYKSGVTDTLQPGSSSQSIPAAATTSPRAKVFGLAQLQQLTQAQHQLFSPRHSKPAQQGSLTARPDGKQPYEVFGLSQYAQQGQAGWSRRPHQQPQQLPVTHKPPQQPVQPVPTASTPIRGINQPSANTIQDVAQALGSTPLSPAQMLKIHSKALTGFEQSEVLQYPDVYFWGLPGAGKHEGTPHSPDLNHGYDDEHGDYRMVLGDHVGYRFEIMGRLGKGSFGQVLKCRDHKSGDLVALKVIRNQKRFHKQAQVEVKILEHLRNQDSEGGCHVVHMREAVPFRNHLCISFELLSINLYDYIKANQFKGSSLRLIRKFATQVLICLRFLRCQRVLHCDLKPENILLREGGRSGIKVIDFGSSCYEGEQVYSYIQSRFYRSPEVMLGLRYGAPIDMWSLACILAELYTGYPLFPGENEVEQMQCVMEILGPPPAQLVQKGSRRDHFFEGEGQPRMTPNKAGLRRYPGSKELAQALACSDAHFVSFLQMAPCKQFLPVMLPEAMPELSLELRCKACLSWDPKERLTPDDALQHIWIQSPDVPSMPAPTQPIAPVATQNWSPRNHPNTASTSWLSRLQPEASSGKLGGHTGNSTSRNVGDKREGVSLILPAHSSGASAHWGSKPGSWLLQPTRHQ